MTAIVFGAYLAAIFAIGAVALRRTRTEGDYWIAGGKLGWLLGGATLAATHASAGTYIGTVGVIHTVGWEFTWLVLFIPFSYWFMAGVLAPRFARTREMTLPAFIERRYYSRRARALAAVVILIAVTVYIQAQVIAGGLIAEIAFGIPAVWGMVFFTVILLAYTAVGGMVAVVYTDLVQLVVMVIGALVAVPMVFQLLGGPGPLFTAVEALRPEAFEFGSLPGVLLFTMGISFLLGGVATPEKLVRLYAIRDQHEIRRGLFLAMIVATGVNLLVFLIALGAMGLFPILPSGDLAMPLIASYALPPVLGTVLLAAVVSAIMSTVDSLLLVAGSALSHDLLGVLRPGASPRSRMLAARLGILIVGIAPLVLILSGVGEGELVQFIVLLFTAIMASAFFVPVVLGVFWRGLTREGALAAMVGGVAAVFVWQSGVLPWPGWGPEFIHSAAPGVAVSLVLGVVVSRFSAPPPESALSPLLREARRRLAVKLAGRRVLVTGGAQGMGLLIACGAAERGAHVAIWDLNEKALPDAASRISAARRSDDQIVGFGCGRRWGSGRGFGRRRTAPSLVRRDGRARQQRRRRLGEAPGGPLSGGGSTHPSGQHGGALLDHRRVPSLHDRKGRRAHRDDGVRRRPDWSPGPFRLLRFQIRGPSDSTNLSGTNCAGPRPAFAPV